MNIIKWNVLNADDEIISTIIATTREAASAKLKFRFPNTWMFLYLIKAKENK